MATARSCCHGLTSRGTARHLWDALRHAAIQAYSSTMSARSISIAAAVFVATAIGFVAPASAETLDQLLARNVAARGGEAKLRAVTSLRITGKATFGGGDFQLEA